MSPTPGRPVATTARWLCQAAPSARKALAQWEAGGTTPLTVGRHWDLVEIDFTLATAAVTRLRDADRHIGLYLMGGMEHAMWWLLPLGTAPRLTGVPGIRPRPRGSELFAPPPGKYRGDRVWVLPGQDGDAWRTLTAPDDLRHAAETGMRLLDRKAVTRCP
ncbi:hypothetical protein ACH4PU_10180 [Streptomyces sp. NPDC021100]|uniref:hypothetical protein n=1 Tax=Streptomyces sp. NPDC021100 TaxID=3365114 RepID=UPI00378CF7B6